MSDSKEMNKENPPGKVIHDANLEEEINDQFEDALLKGIENSNPNPEWRKHITEESSDFSVCPD